MKIKNIDNEDQVAGINQELVARDVQLGELTEKNRVLTNDCRAMQERIFDEKKKIIDMMNCANELNELTQSRVCSNC